ncbi:MAG: hypothetical protein A2Z14_01270 [Chloroflexi bacterium RBG_16_48_8]|nr:MAG: hypothetical protein A2Z14_01270 [Chloroflexi bacterium RBG_16_48_8]
MNKLYQVRLKVVYPSIHSYWTLIDLQKSAARGVSAFPSKLCAIHAIQGTKNVRCSSTSTKIKSPKFIYEWSIFHTSIIRILYPVEMGFDAHHTNRRFEETRYDDRQTAESILIKWVA